MTNYFNKPLNASGRCRDYMLDPPDDAEIVCFECGYEITFGEDIEHGDYVYCPNCYHYCRLL